MCPQYFFVNLVLIFCFCRYLIFLNCQRSQILLLSLTDFICMNYNKFLHTLNAKNQSDFMIRGTNF